MVFDNPGITELFLELARPEWTSVFPHPNRVVCGGIAVPDCWDTTVDDAVTERIKDGAYAFLGEPSDDAWPTPAPPAIAKP